jgi:two-component system, LytTR family, sensor kinase
MPTPGTPELLHLMGYVTGASLYAMLLAMVVRAQTGTDRLALVTALLGLAWNVGEMSSHAATALRAPYASTWLSAASYVALGFLAAVVVHSVSRVRTGSESSFSRAATRTIAALAYVFATAAALMHVVAAGSGQPVPSSTALAVVAIGLGLLALPLILLTHRQPQGLRALWMTALAVFTVSALHLGRFHGADENWTTELLGHHASIPLAFAILYQDYRFALADLFLKQALILIALVAGVMAVYTTIEPALVAGGLGGAAALLSGWVLTLLLFPIVRRAVTWFVDRVVLSRADYNDVLDRLSAALAESRTADDALSCACAELAPALSASTVQWKTQTLINHAGLAASEIPIWTTDAPHYVLLVGTLAGGRRLLSGDVSMLERASVLIARRIDALRLTDERYERMLREREMTTLAAEAELRALRAQVNPHFLFNALTTIGYLIQSAPPRALDTLMRLTTLLRGVLRSDGEFTTLGRERELIECYLQIEHERFEERLAIELDIPRELDDATIPALIVQPLVENAIKHGIARSRTGGLVSVTARVETDTTPPELHIVVRNTGSKFAGREPAHDGGVGLRNVERRLQVYYGDAARLTITRDGKSATVATLRLPAIGLSDEPATADQVSSSP